jgi:hypothetical protein
MNGGWRMYRSSRDIRLTIFSICYMIACLFIACVGNSIADRINPNNHLPIDQRKPLPDVLLSFLNYYYVKLRLPVNLSDHLIGVCAVAILARILTMQSSTLTVLRRFLFVAGTVYVIRAITVVLTVLPNPLVECESNPSDNLFYDALQIFLLKRTTCGDVFFSGHTIIFTLAGAIWTTYSRNSMMRTLMTVISFLGMISLVGSAYHYTVDVMFGYFVTSWVWAMYHWIATLDSFRKTWFGRLLYRIDNSEFHRRDLIAADTEEYEFTVIYDENHSNNQ